MRTRRCRSGWLPCPRSTLVPTGLTRRTAAGKVSDVSYEGAVFDLEKKGAFKFSLSVPSGGSANLAMTLEHAAKVCGTDVALKYTATAGQDNGVISGKFKATDDVDATLVYDLDRFSGLDVNKLSCVVKYNVDDDTHVSASYHARNKKSVVRASKKVDDSNTVEAAAFLTLDGGFAFNSAEATLTNAMSDGDLQVRARVDGSNKVSLAVNKEWNLDV